MIRNGKRQETKEKWSEVKKLLIIFSLNLYQQNAWALNEVKALEFLRVFQKKSRKQI